MGDNSEQLRNKPLAEHRVRVETMPKDGPVSPAREKSKFLKATEKLEGLFKDEKVKKSFEFLGRKKIDETDQQRQVAFPFSSKVKERYDALNKVKKYVDGAKKEVDKRDEQRKSLEKAKRDLTVDIASATVLDPIVGMSAATDVAQGVYHAGKIAASEVKAEWKPLISEKTAKDAKEILEGFQKQLDKAYKEQVIDVIVRELQDISIVGKLSGDKEEIKLISQYFEILNGYLDGLEEEPREKLIEQWKKELPIFRRKEKSDSTLERVKEKAKDFFQGDISQDPDVCLARAIPAVITKVGVDKVGVDPVFDDVLKLRFLLNCQAQISRAERILHEKGILKTDRSYNSSHDKVARDIISSRDAVFKGLTSERISFVFVKAEELINKSDESHKRDVLQELKGYIDLLTALKGDKKTAEVLSQLIDQDIQEILKQYNKKFGTEVTLENMSHYIEIRLLPHGELIAGLSSDDERTRQRSIDEVIRRIEKDMDLSLEEVKNLNDALSEYHEKASDQEKARIAKPVFQAHKNTAMALVRVVQARNVTDPELSKCINGFYSEWLDNLKKEGSSYKPDREQSLSDLRGKMAAIKSSEFTQYQEKIKRADKLRELLNEKRHLKSYYPETAFLAAYSALQLSEFAKRVNGARNEADEKAKDIMTIGDHEVYRRLTSELKLVQEQIAGAMVHRLCLAKEDKPADLVAELYNATKSESEAPMDSSSVYDLTIKDIEDFVAYIEQYGDDETKAKLKELGSANDIIAARDEVENRVLMEYFNANTSKDSLRVYQAATGLAEVLPFVSKPSSELESEFQKVGEQQRKLRLDLQVAKKSEEVRKLTEKYQKTQDEFYLTQLAEAKAIFVELRSQQDVETVSVGGPTQELDDECKALFDGIGKQLVEAQVAVQLEPDDIAEREAKIEQQQMRVEGLETARSVCDNELQDLGTQLAEHKCALAELRSQQDLKTESSNEEVAGQIKSLEEKIKKIEPKYKEGQATFSAIDVKLTKAREKLIELQSQQDTVVTSDRQTDKKTPEIGRLKEEYQRHQATQQKIVGQLKELNKECSRYTRQVESEFSPLVLVNSQWALNLESKKEQVARELDRCKSVVSRENADKLEKDIEKADKSVARWDRWTALPVLGGICKFVMKRFDGDRETRSQKLDNLKRQQAEIQQTHEKIKSLEARKIQLETLGKSATDYVVKHIGREVTEKQISAEDIEKVREFVSTHNPDQSKALEQKIDCCGRFLFDLVSDGEYVTPVDELGKTAENIRITSGEEKGAAADRVVSLLAGKSEYDGDDVVAQLKRDLSLLRPKNDETLSDEKCLKAIQEKYLKPILNDTFKKGAEVTQELVERDTKLLKFCIPEQQQEYSEQQKTYVKTLFANAQKEIQGYCAHSAIFFKTMRAIKSNPEDSAKTAKEIVEAKQDAFIEFARSKEWKSVNKDWLYTGLDLLVSEQLDLSNDVDAEYLGLPDDTKKEILAGAQKHKRIEDTLANANEERQKVTEARKQIQSLLTQLSVFKGTEGFSNKCMESLLKPLTEHLTFCAANATVYDEACRASDTKLFESMGAMDDIVVPMAFKQALMGKPAEGLAMKWGYDFACQAENFANPREINHYRLVGMKQLVEKAGKGCDRYSLQTNFNQLLMVTMDEETGSMRVYEDGAGEQREYIVELAQDKEPTWAHKMLVDQFGTEEQKQTLRKNIMTHLKAVQQDCEEKLKQIIEDLLTAREDGQLRSNEEILSKFEAFKVQYVKPLRDFVKKSIDQLLPTVGGMSLGEFCKIKQDKEEVQAIFDKFDGLVNAAQRALAIESGLIGIVANKKPTVDFGKLMTDHQEAFKELPCLTGRIRLELANVLKTCEGKMSLSELNRLQSVVEQFGSEKQKTEFIQLYGQVGSKVSECLGAVKGLLSQKDGLERRNDLAAQQSGFLQSSKNSAANKILSDELQENISFVLQCGDAKDKEKLSKVLGEYTKQEMDLKSGEGKGLRAVLLGEIHRAWPKTQRKAFLDAHQKALGEIATRTRQPSVMSDTNSEPGTVAADRRSEQPGTEVASSFGDGSDSESEEGMQTPRKGGTKEGAQQKDSLGEGKHHRTKSTDFDSVEKPVDRPDRIDGLPPPPISTPS